MVRWVSAALAITLIGRTVGRAVLALEQRVVPLINVSPGRAVLQIFSLPLHAQPPGQVGLVKATLTIVA